MEALPLLTDGGESSAFSEDDGSDGSSYDFGEPFMEETGKKYLRDLEEDHSKILG